MEKGEKKICIYVSVAVVIAIAATITLLVLSQTYNWFDKLKQQDSYFTSMRSLPSPLYPLQNKDVLCKCKNSSRGWCRNGVKYYTYGEEQCLSPLNINRENVRGARGVRSETVCNSMGYEWTNKDGIGRCILKN